MYQAASIPVYVTSQDEVAHPDIQVFLGSLLGPEGNAFAVLGAFQAALRDAGVDPAPYLADATSGDYEHLLQVVRSTATTLETPPLRPEDLADQA